MTAPSYEERIGSDVQGTPAAGVETPIPARLYCNLGDVTNLAVARGSSCLFTRIAAFGIEGIAQKLAERRQLTLEHSRQWLTHVGLEQPLESIDGDAGHIAAARECLAEGAAKLADELRLSLEYYGAQDDAVAVEDIVACGPGATIPGLVERLQRDLGHRVLDRQAVGPRAPRRPFRCPADPVLRPRAGAVAMRPVNLIPPEDRRGDHAPLRAGSLSYIIVGAIAAGLLAVVALVLTQNSITEHENEIEQLEVARDAATQQAEALAPYAEFASLQEQRELTISSARHEPVRLGARPARARDRHSLRR